MGRNCWRYGGGRRGLKDWRRLRKTQEESGLSWGPALWWVKRGWATPLRAPGMPSNLMGGICWNPGLGLMPVIVNTSIALNVCQGLLCSLHLLMHLIFPSMLWDKHQYCYYSHIPNEEIEAERGWIICSSHWAGGWWSGMQSRGTGSRVCAENRCARMRPGKWVPKCTSRKARLSSWGPHFTTSVMEEVWIMMRLVKVNGTEWRKRALWVEGFCTHIQGGGLVCSWGEGRRRRGWKTDFPKENSAGAPATGTSERPRGQRRDERQERTPGKGSQPGGQHPSGIHPDAEMDSECSPPYKTPSGAPLGTLNTWLEPSWSAPPADLLATPRRSPDAQHTLEVPGCLPHRPPTQRSLDIVIRILPPSLSLLLKPSSSLPGQFQGCRIPEASMPFLRLKRTRLPAWFTVQCFLLYSICWPYLYLPPMSSLSSGNNSLLNWIKENLGSTQSPPSSSVCDCRLVTKPLWASLPVWWREGWAGWFWGPCSTDLRAVLGTGHHQVGNHWASRGQPVCLRGWAHLPCALCGPDSMCL